MMTTKGENQAQSNPLSNTWGQINLGLSLWALEMASGMPHCLRRPVLQVLASTSVTQAGDGWEILWEPHHPGHTQNVL